MRLLVFPPRRFSTGPLSRVFVSECVWEMAGSRVAAGGPAGVSREDLVSQPLEAAGPVTQAPREAFSFHLSRAWAAVGVHTHIPDSPTTRPVDRAIFMQVRTVIFRFSCGEKSMCLGRPFWNLSLLRYRDVRGVRARSRCGGKALWGRGRGPGTKPRCARASLGCGNSEEGSQRVPEPPSKAGPLPLVGERPDVALLVAGTLLPDEMCPRRGLCGPR